MKKILLKGALLVSSFCMVACGGSGASNSETSSNSSSGEPSSSAEPINEWITDEASLNYAVNELYPGKDLLDTANGFNDISSVKKMRAFSNGAYAGSFTSASSRQDIKLELYNDAAVRFANVSNGYAFTLPTNEVTVDYTIAKYRTVFTFGDSILSASFESSNPYTNLSNPWYTYASEWLMTHLMKENFMENQGLTRTIPYTYNFTASNSYGDLNIKPGFDVYLFGIKIDHDTNNQIERPYYNISIIREKNDSKNFCLFVMKSKTEQSALMEKIVASYARISSKGTPRNYFYSEAAKPDPRWDKATKGLFDKLVTTEYVNWGVTSYSLPGTTDSLHPGQSGYDQTLAWCKQVVNSVETAWEHKCEIWPTYTHVAYGTNYCYFPLDMAKEVAGGDGVNGKPFLQFSLQYTTNNNTVSGELTPIYDIMRGKYDDYFHKLAQDMKAYGAPILLRLNNEMNTDWTSYCGMMSLLDPDIFTMTWRRLYDICVEEGCTNIIWIWNPIAQSCPYSSWGEDLCYWPGEDYVQLLGATNYEFNNYDAAEAELKCESFKERYSSLFKKNSKNFSTDWKVIISEFACGSGGETTGELGRNRAVQAKWVKEMFEEMNALNPADYIKQIRGAVWFNANDYDGNKISNRLQIVMRPDRPREKYDDLVDTLAAFKKGFIDQDERLGIKHN